VRKMVSYQVFRFASPRLDELEKFKNQFGQVYEPRARVNPALAAIPFEVAKENARIGGELVFLVFNSKLPYCQNHPYGTVGEVKSMILERVEKGDNEVYDLHFCLPCTEEEYERQICNCRKPFSYTYFDFNSDSCSGRILHISGAYEKERKIYENRLDALRRGLLCDGQSYCE